MVCKKGKDFGTARRVFQLFTVIKKEFFRDQKLHLMGNKCVNLPYLLVNMRQSASEELYCKPLHIGLQDSCRKMMKNLLIFFFLMQKMSLLQASFLSA